MKKSSERIEEQYLNDRKRLLARVRAAGRTLEEAEDFVQDMYAEVMEHVAVIPDIGNLAAWINTLFGRRLIDDWRRRKMRRMRGECDVEEEVLREILVETGLDPLEQWVRDGLADAINDALAGLPAEQRKILEAQVFGGMTFREISQASGECIETLASRKRYAVKNLARSLRHWIET